MVNRHNDQFPPVIFIHGMAGSRWDWEELERGLRVSGYTTYALDLIGHGNSHKPKDPQDYHIESVFFHLQEWIGGLKLDRPPVMVGHSLGGYLSLLYAMRNSSQITGLVLIAPFYSPAQLPPWLSVLLRQPTLGQRAYRLTPGWLVRLAVRLDPTHKAPLSLRDRRQIAADFKRASPHIVYIPSGIPDLTPELSQVRLPALVLWGSRDPTLKPRSFPGLVSALPDAKGVEFKGAGHQPHRMDPERVTRLLVNFINELEERFQICGLWACCAHPNPQIWVSPRRFPMSR